MKRGLGKMEYSETEKEGKRERKTEGGKRKGKKRRGEETVGRRRGGRGTQESKDLALLINHSAVCLL